MARKTAASKSTTAPKDDKSVASDLLKKYGTKSTAIRELTSKDWPRRRIADALGIKYQHVRNVQVRPLKRTS